METSSLADEGIALLCDENGLIRSIIRDAIGSAVRIPLGSHLTQLADAADRIKAQNFFAELQRERAAFDWEIGVTSADGAQRIVPLHFAGGESDGGFLIIVAHSRDALEQLNEELMRINNEQTNALRRASRELARRNEARDDAIYDELTRVNNDLANLQRAMAKANVELTQINEQKNRLLGMAAHDLRNPLGVILAFSEFLQADADDRFSNEQREFIACIRNSSQFMLGLINDLLDVSSIESGQLKLQPGPGDLLALIEANVALNRVLAQKKGISIHFTPPAELPALLFDCRKIEQVLNNLLGNAVKFSHSGSCIDLELKVTPGWIIVAVYDQGQGIPAEDISRLFTPFGTTRVRSTAGEPSTGLGLAIARKIVEGHGGEIGVSSTAGTGSCFHFSLPTLEP